MKKSKRYSAAIAWLPVVACVLGLAAPVHAASGTITGVWKFWNKNGNYCPTTNACVGSRYPQSLYDSLQPVSNATVWVMDQNFVVIGAGSTATDGSYTVSWSGSPTQVRSVIAARQKDGRFFFTNPSAQQIANSTATFSPVASQNVGTWWVGTSASPDPYYNSYWAAEQEWRNVLGLVGSATANFTNVEIRGFADNMPSFMGNLPSSKADGPTKRVQLDANAGFAPQARVMHELGHIATYVAHPWTFTEDYSWGGLSGWGQGVPEYGDTAFEEGFATHYGSIAFWWDNSVSPTTCLSSATCYSGGVPLASTDIEATSYPFSTNNCDRSVGNPEARWPLSAMRFFWDVFDAHNDADADAYGVNSAGHFWQHLAMLAFYPDGTSTNQINEPWNSTFTSASEPDGRGSISYRDNYANALGVSLSTLHVDNCSPF